MFTILDFDEHYQQGNINIYRVGKTVYEVLGMLPVIKPCLTTTQAKREFRRSILKIKLDFSYQLIADNYKNMDPTELRDRMNYLNKLINE